MDDDDDDDDDDGDDNNNNEDKTASFMSPFTDNIHNQSIIPSTDVIQLTLTLNMTTAQVVETKSLSTTTVLFTFVNIIPLTCPSDRVMTSLYVN